VGDRVDKWVDVALEEYKSLRQESLGAIEQMQRTLQIGLAAIGVITGFAVSAANSGVADDTAVCATAPVQGDSAVRGDVSGVRPSCMAARYGR
jgi:hypothetical protein